MAINKITPINSNTGMMKISDTYTISSTQTETICTGPMFPKVSLGPLAYNPRHIFIYKSMNKYTVL